MPRVKIEDREYGMGADTVDLPEDVKGYGPREISGIEFSNLSAKLSAFGFELVTTKTVLDVYAIEGNNRRRLMFAGGPVRVIALEAVLQAMPAPRPKPEAPQPPADTG
jgi:hypothetical protein